MGSDNYVISDNLAPQLALESQSIPHAYLPGTIKILTPKSNKVFLKGFGEYIQGAVIKELNRRSEFISTLERETDFNIDTSLFIRNASLQPWIIYFTQEGGLPDEEITDEYGLIPCTSRRHHAVYWQETEFGVRSMILTANEKGSCWSDDSDVGHEIAHATFGPIPIKAQMHFDDTMKMLYIFSELAVTTFRGEVRDNETGLPTLDTYEELDKFLYAAQKLVPGIGFEDLILIKPLTPFTLTRFNRFKIKLGYTSLKAVNLFSGMVNQL